VYSIDARRGNGGGACLASRHGRCCGGNMLLRRVRARHRAERSNGGPADCDRHRALPNRRSAAARIAAVLGHILRNRVFVRTRTGTDRTT
jgi:hypothetical protein